MVFFYWPLLLPPCTAPCKIVLAGTADLDTYPNHFNLRFFTVVKLSSWGPISCPILSALLVMQSISSVFLAIDEEKEKYYKLGKVESSAIYFKSPKLIQLCWFQNSNAIYFLVLKEPFMTYILN